MRHFDIQSCIDTFLLSYVLKYDYYIEGTLIATLDTDIDINCILALPTKVLSGSFMGKLITWDFVDSIIQDT